MPFCTNYKLYLALVYFKLGLNVNMKKKHKQEEEKKIKKINITLHRSFLLLNLIPQ